MSDRLTAPLDDSGDLRTVVGACHDYLARLLDWHQQAVVERDAGLAAGFWQLHRAMLRLHVELEDAHLLAAHAQAALQPTWATAVYLAEHRKLLAMADAIGAEIAGCGGRVLQRREVIAVLDRQRSFKNLIEHHEDREEKGLLPELAACLPVSVSEALTARCRQRWSPMIASQRQQLAGLLERLDCYPAGGRGPVAPG